MRKSKNWGCPENENVLGCWQDWDGKQDCDPGAKVLNAGRGLTGRGVDEAMRRGKQRTVLQGGRGALREPLDLETAVQTKEPAGLWVPPPKARAMLAAQRWSGGGGVGAAVLQVPLW